MARYALTAPRLYHGTNLTVREENVTFGSILCGKQGPMYPCIMDRLAELLGLGLGLGGPRWAEAAGLRLDAAFWLLPWYWR